MKNLTLKQLRYFEALMRHGHFGRAADACAISQPALSLQIKEMETSLGISLFERAAREVRPTTFGREIAARARDILRAVDDLADLARVAQAHSRGQLRLGIIPTIAPYLLPALIGRLAVAKPHLDMHVRETLTEKLIEELKDGRLDAAIVALPVSEVSLLETPLFEETFVLVRPARDAGLPVPDGEALRRMRLLLLEEGHCFRDQALSFCGMRPNLPREGLDGSSLTTLVQMVGSGIGVTLIPEMAVPIETHSAQVSITRFEAPGPRRTIGMVWRKSSPMVEQLLQIAAVVKQSAECLEGQKAQEAVG
jgi:LysR family hydrogen peroxide-inducible transcriptional activator